MGRCRPFIHEDFLGRLHHIDEIQRSLIGGYVGMCENPYEIYFRPKQLTEDEILENFKASFDCFREILAARRQAGAKLDMTKPRYDAVFMEGIACLNSSE
jgi:hypothetical protein